MYYQMQTICYTTVDKDCCNRKQDKLTVIVSSGLCVIIIKLIQVYRKYDTNFTDLDKSIEITSNFCEIQRFNSKKKAVALTIEDF